MEKITRSSCSQAPPSRVLVPPAALPGDRCRSLMTLTNQQSVARSPRCRHRASRGSRHGLDAAHGPPVLPSLRRQKGAVLSCPSSCGSLSGSDSTPPLFSASPVEARRACSALG